MAEQRTNDKNRRKPRKKYSGTAGGRRLSWVRGRGSARHRVEASSPQALRAFRAQFGFLGTKAGRPGFFERANSSNAAARASLQKPFRRAALGIDEVWSSHISPGWAWASSLARCSLGGQRTPKPCRHGSHSPFERWIAGALERRSGQGEELGSDRDRSAIGEFR